MLMHFAMKDKEIQLANITAFKGEQMQHESIGHVRLDVERSKREDGNDTIKELRWETLENRRRKTRITSLYRAHLGQKAWVDITAQLEKPTYYGRNDHDFKIRCRKQKTDVEEQRLRVFENKVLRKIFGAKRDEVTGEWRKLHNTELHALYSPPDIIRNIKSRRLRWAGHVARMGESRNAYRVKSKRIPMAKKAFNRKRELFCGPLEKELRRILVKCFVWSDIVWGQKHGHYDEVKRND
ncbi:hypothetical protein ANN_07368 [Periplaneta americana]|uniref:Endonuclease-reverse transcriptase n=1 Tax=Periplaneta americana TaxID=6978 RepID=A0ABQ8SZS3_PERAM|nr:hypothetical protein ANN_07368 [Periplaneta americana]